MIFPKILSILSQNYALQTLRDDLTVLQHHSYQIQELENRPDSSYLAKRDGAIATLYWDAGGAIKAIFNMAIDHEVAQAFQNSGVNLAQSVMAECERYILYAPGRAAVYILGATWTAQLGSHWRNILRSPHGVATVAFGVVLRPQWNTPGCRATMLEVLQQWFTQGGNSANVMQVQNARDVGNAPANQFIDGGSIIEERAIGDPSNSKSKSKPKSRFCDSPIQNSPFVFTVGKLDSLLTSPITC